MLQCLGEAHSGWHIKHLDFVLMLFLGYVTIHTACITWSVWSLGVICGSEPDTCIIALCSCYSLFWEALHVYMKS